MKKVLIALVIVLIILIGGTYLVKTFIDNGNSYTGEEAELTDYTAKTEGYYTLEQNNQAIIYYEIVDGQDNIIAEKTSPNNDIIYLKPEYTLSYRNAKLKEGLTYQWDEAITSGVFHAGDTIDPGAYSFTATTEDDICSYTISTSPNEYISDIVEQNTISGTEEIEVAADQYLRYLDCQVTKVA